MVGSGGVVRPIRRVSILADVQDHATAQLAGLNGAAMKMSNSFQAGANNVNQMKRALIGWAAVAGASALAMGALVRVGSNLDRTFAIIEESANATTEQMDAITSKTRQLSAEMPVMMGDVTKAFEEFTYAGFSAQEAIDASTGAVEMAVAGQMQMADAVQTTTSIINAFNLEAEQSNYVASTLSATFANSAIEIDQIGSAMQYASAQMAGMGFAASETAAAIGTMADQGIRGTMAGTSLNQAFSKLISGAGETEHALKAAGLSIDSFTDEEGNMQSMVEVVGMLSEKSENLTDAQMMEWLEDLAGRRGARALRPLIENFEKFEKKVQTNALAAVKDFSEEMGQLEQAQLALQFNAENPEEIEKQMESMSDEAVIEWAQQEDLDLSQFEEGFDVIKRMHAMRDEMEPEEMQEKLAAMFDMEEETAQELAHMINDQETSLEDLSSAYEEATTSGELASAQMDTVGGKFTYLKGSIQSAAYTMYTGFRPVLSSLLDLLIGFVDIINANETALRALGGAFFVVFLYATSKLAIILKLWAAQTGLAQSIWGTVAATVAHGKALGLLNPALLVEIVRTRSLTPLKFQLTAAMAASSSAAIQEARMLLLTGNVKKGLKVLTVALTKSLWAQAAAMWAAYWPVLAFIGAVGVLIAYKKNWLGIADLLGPAVERIGDAVDYVTGKVVQLVTWFRDLNTVGKILLALPLAFISPWLAGAAVLGIVITKIAEMVGATDWLADHVQSLLNYIGGIPQALGLLAAAITWILDDVLGGLIRSLVAGIEWWAGLYESVTARIQSALLSLISPVELVKRAFGTIGSVIAGLLPYVTLMAGGLLGIHGAGAKVSGLAPEFSSLGNVLNWLTENVFTLENAFLLVLGAIVPIIKPLIYVYKVLNWLGFVPDLFESITGKLEDMHLMSVNVLDTLTGIWELLRDIAFTPFDLDIDISLPDIDISQWFRNRIAELEAMRKEMQRHFEEFLGSDLVNRLESLDEKIFGWIPDSDDAQRAGERTRGLLGAVRESFAGFQNAEAIQRLETIEDKLFGWIPDGDDAKRAGERTRSLLGAVRNGFVDFQNSEAIQRLETIEDKLFGWIPDAGDAQWAGDKTREYLGAIKDAILDFEFPNINWDKLIPDWVQNTIDKIQGWRSGGGGGDDGGGSDDGGDDGGSDAGGDRRRAGGVEPGSSTRGAAQQKSMRPQTGTQVQLLGTGAGAPAGAGAGASRGIEYIDERSVDVSQDPTIEIEINGNTLDAGRIQTEIERALDNSRHQMLEDLIDWITLGGPQAIDEGIGGEPSDGQEGDQQGEEGQEGEGGEGQEGEDDTSEDGEEETDGEETEPTDDDTTFV